jgi:hypothetical protein
MRCAPQKQVEKSTIDNQLNLTNVETRRQDHHSSIGRAAQPEDHLRVEEAHAVKRTEKAGAAGRLVRQAAHGEPLTR